MATRWVTTGCAFLITSTAPSTWARSDCWRGWRGERRSRGSRRNSAIDTEIGSTTEFAVRRNDLKRFHLETGLRLDRNGRRP